MKLAEFIIGCIIACILGVLLAVILAAPTFDCDKDHYTDVCK